MLPFFKVSLVTKWLSSSERSDYLIVNQEIEIRTGREHALNEVFGVIEDDSVPLRLVGCLASHRLDLHAL